MKLLVASLLHFLSNPPPLSLCLLQMAGVVSGRDETSDDITEDKSAAGLNLLCLSAFRSKQQKKR